MWVKIDKNYFRDINPSSLSISKVSFISTPPPLACFEVGSLKVAPLKKELTTVNPVRVLCQWYYYRVALRYRLLGRCLTAGCVVR